MGRLQRTRQLLTQVHPLKNNHSHGIDDGGNDNIDKSGLSIDIVVAVYNENIDWIANHNLQGHVILYVKKDSRPIHDIGYKKIVRLPNVGREGHTYLHHILENYDSLADVTFFLQGDPFDHGKRTLRFLKNPAMGAGDISCLANGHTDCHNFICPLHPEIAPTTKHICQEMFIDHNGYNRYGPGALLRVSRDTIQCRSTSFYRRLIQFLDYDVNPIEGFSMERLWSSSVFNPNIKTPFV